MQNKRRRRRSASPSSSSLGLGNDAPFDFLTAEATETVDYEMDSSASCAPFPSAGSSSTPCAAPDAAPDAARDDDDDSDDSDAPRADGRAHSGTDAAPDDASDDASVTGRDDGDDSDAPRRADGRADAGCADAAPDDARDDGDSDAPRADGRAEPEASKHTQLAPAWQGLFGRGVDNLRGMTDEQLKPKKTANRSKALGLSAPPNATLGKSSRAPPPPAPDPPAPPRRPLESESGGGGRVGGASSATSASASPSRGRGNSSSTAPRRASSAPPTSRPASSCDSNQSEAGEVESVVMNPGSAGRVYPFDPEWRKGRQWLKNNDEGMWCAICTEYCDALPSRRPVNFKWAKRGAKIVTSTRKSTVTDHEKHETHIAAVERRAQRASSSGASSSSASASSGASSSPAALTAAVSREVDTTELNAPFYSLFENAFLCGLRNLPNTNFVYMCDRFAPPPPRPPPRAPVGSLCLVLIAAADYF